MVKKWKAEGKRDTEINALWNAYVPNHLLPRLTGFELMMAPYAIAHVKLGLKLSETGYTFGSDARAQIYLTNALEPAQDLDMQLVFMSEALAHEAKAANEAKGTRFTVVVGNPPYAGNSGNPSKDSRGRLTWIGSLIAPYFTFQEADLGERNPRWLNNDYVKFIRFAEYQITLSGAGCLSLITSHSWLDSATFRGMREKLLSAFSSMRIIDCHGNIKKSAHAGDQGVFDIEEGVAIISAECGISRQELRHFDLIGPLSSKFDWLRNSTSKNVNVAALIPSGRYLDLRPASMAAADEYEGFPSIRDILTASSLGFVTHRDGFAFALDGNEMTDRLRRFASQDDAEFQRVVEEFDLSSNRDWSIATARILTRARIGRPLDICDFRPFDRRETAVGPEIMDYPRNLLMDHVVGRDNVVINISRQQNKVGFKHVLATKYAAESCLVSAGTKEQNYAIPLWSFGKGTEAQIVSNIAPAFANCVAALTGLAWDDCVEGPKQGALAGVIAPKPTQTAIFATRRERGEPGKSFGPRDLFDWIYAVLHSPAYRSRYADYLKSDFARVPLPGSAALFEALVPLGTRLVALHLLDAPAAPDLADPKPIRFVGNVEPRVAAKPEFKAGRVHINAGCWFEDVPERAWNFHIGGYQPAQKWLKDRAAKGGKKASDGRVLTPDDLLHYRRMITAMDATIDIMAQIDTIIDQHGGWPTAFKGMTDDGD
jgi:predicted helicase